MVKRDGKGVGASTPWLEWLALWHPEVRLSGMLEGPAFPLKGLQLDKLPTVPNITNIKHSHLRNPTPRQRLPQQHRRLQHILLCQHPRPPMNPHRPLTLRILENLHRIEWVRMHGAHNPARVIRPNRNQA